MARLAIYSHAPSDSVNLLKAAMGEQGVDVIKIRRTGSTFRGRADDLIINYGSSSMPALVVGRARVLNKPEVIAQASNKVNSFNKFLEHGVKTVDWTTRPEMAQSWLDDGDMVYVRRTLQGHSGEGITIAHRNPAGVGDAGGIEVSATLRTAPLYTKAILSERREFRIHVMGGVITYVQQKRRRDGYRDEADYSNLVRNHHTGWIYATQNADVCDEAKVEALKAVAALGLDYGAVDVITRRGEAWVLEVNTAPGMSGTNLETYTNNFLRIFAGQEPEGSVVDFTELQEEIRQVVETEPQERAGELDAMLAYQQANRAPEESVNVSAAASRPQPIPYPQSAQAQRTVTPAPAEARPAPIPAAQPQPATTAVAPLIDNGFYKLIVNEERTLGQWDEDMGHFLIIGWEVPVELNDSTIIGVVSDF